MASAFIGAIFGVVVAWSMGLVGAEHTPELHQITLFVGHVLILGLSANIIMAVLTRLSWPKSAMITVTILGTLTVGFEIWVFMPVYTGTLDPNFKLFEPEQIHCLITLLSIWILMTMIETYFSVILRRGAGSS